MSVCYECRCTHTKCGFCKVNYCACTAQYHGQEICG